MNNWILQNHPWTQAGIDWINYLIENGNTLRVGDRVRHLPETGGRRYIHPGFSGVEGTVVAVYGDKFGDTTIDKPWYVGVATDVKIIDEDGQLKDQWRSDCFSLEKIESSALFKADEVLK